MQNICFISNFYRTILFREVQKEMSKNGEYKIYWISCSKFWFKWLNKTGVTKNEILNLSYDNKTHKKFLHSEKFQESLNDIKKIEKGMRISLNSIILSDRRLKNQKHDFALGYLVYVYQQATDFFRDKDIRFVFSEITHAHEVLLSEVSFQKQFSLFALHPVRLPNDRFSFFEGYNQEKIVELFNNDIDSKKNDSKPSKKLTNIEKPKYFYLNLKKPNIAFNWIGKTLKHLLRWNIQRRGDQTALTLPWLIKTRTKEVFNSKIEGKFSIKKYDDINELKPFVVYAMQVQPESSVDVWAPYFSNQFEVIKNIARSLPVGHRLLVKQHPNAKGKFGYNFYNRIRKLPATSVLDGSIDSHLILKDADIVMTVSGTIAYEAALMGKKSILFSDVFFNQLDLVSVCKDFSQLKSQIQDVLSKKVDKVKHLKKGQKFIAKTSSMSFKGFVSDPNHDPSVIDSENIKSIVNAIETLIER